MRIIDAEAFIENIRKFLPTIHQSYLAEAVMRIVKEVIDKQPTIEVKPVVHAHWENGQCSNCKGFALSFDNEPYRKVILSNFCPHCGAQMDEFASDNNVGSKTEEVSG